MSQPAEFERLVGLITKLLVVEHENWYEQVFAWETPTALAYQLPNNTNYKFRVQNPQDIQQIALEIDDNSFFTKVPLTYWQRIKLRLSTARWYAIQQKFKDQIINEKLASTIRKHIN